MASQEDSKSLSQERYTRYGQAYVGSQTHAKGAELERFVTTSQPEPEWQALDVATGGGHTALKFAQHVRRVTATDLTNKMVQVARDFITSQGIDNVEFLQADAENLPFNDQSFNLVTCRIAAHHFPRPDRFVRESARVLKPGGKLLVQDQIVPEDREAARRINIFERIRDPSHHRTLSQGELLALFQENGLSVYHHEHFIKKHNFINWAEMQGCSPKTIQELIELLAQAPLEVKDWLQPEGMGDPDATFVNHHTLIAGKKL